MSKERLLELLRLDDAEAIAAQRSDRLAKIAEALLPAQPKAETVEELKEIIAGLRTEIEMLEMKASTYHITSELGRRSTIALLRTLPVPSVIIHTEDLDLDPPASKMKVTAVFDDNPEGWLQLESAD